MKRFRAGQVYHFYDRLGVKRCDVLIIVRRKNYCKIEVRSLSEGYDDGFYTVKITTINNMTECIPLSDKSLYVLHITADEELNRQCYATNKLLSFIRIWCGAFEASTAVIVNQLPRQDLRKSYFNRWFSYIDNHLKKGECMSEQDAHNTLCWMLLEDFDNIDDAIKHSEKSICNHNLPTVLVEILQEVTIIEFTHLDCNELCRSVEEQIAHYLKYVASDYSHPIPIKRFS